MSKHQSTMKENKSKLKNGRDICAIKRCSGNRGVLKSIVVQKEHSIHVLDETGAD